MLLNLKKCRNVYIDSEEGDPTSFYRSNECCKGGHYLPVTRDLSRLKWGSKLSRVLLGVSGQHNLSLCQDRVAKARIYQASGFSLSRMTW